MTDQRSSNLTVPYVVSQFLSTGEALEDHGTLQVVLGCVGTVPLIRSIIEVIHKHHKLICLHLDIGSYGFQGGRRLNRGHFAGGGGLGQIWTTELREEEILLECTLWA